MAQLNLGHFDQVHLVAELVQALADFPFHRYANEPEAMEDFYNWLHDSFKKAGLELSNKRNSFKLHDTHTDNQRFCTELAGAWYRSVGLSLPSSAATSSSSLVIGLPELVSFCFQKLSALVEQSTCLGDKPLSHRSLPGSSAPSGTLARVQQPFKDILY